MANAPEADPLPNPITAGLRAALGMPALGLFAALLGYGAMCKAVGLDFTLMWAAIALIWSMPALMTYTELATAGAGLWVMFGAVLFSNLRNIPMIVTALPLVRAERGIGWKDFVFAQLLSPTVWVHVLVGAQAIHPKSRRPFFMAFAAVIFVSAMAGAAAGYYGVGDLPSALATALLVLTPLYLLLIMVSVRRLSGYLALVLGGIGVPLLMQWSVEWGLAIGGIGAGTLGFALARLLPGRAAK
jgi:hypothetical protein